MYFFQHLSIVENFSKLNSSFKVPINNLLPFEASFTIYMVLLLASESKSFEIVKKWKNIAVSRNSNLLVSKTAG